VVLTSGGFAYAVYLHFKLLRGLANFPENVGLKLRRAIYFTDVKPDQAQAMKAFVGALQLAAQEGMHPLSDEVMGIQAEMARFLEKIGHVQMAIDLFEDVKKDCLRGIDTMGDREDYPALRARLLTRACTASTRLAELYSSPYIGNAQKVEECLVWSVETTLREKRRREVEGVKPGEGEWLDDDQQGTQLEALAHTYEEKDQHYLAAQLFLQALMIKPKKDCHAVILMNNLAASIAQQSPPVEPGQPPPSRAQLIDSARTWAKQALALAVNIKPPERNSECDRGCAVATHNLGEFAEMDGNIPEARDKYEEAGSIAHAIGFEEGVKSANEGLRRLSSGNKKKKGKKAWW